MSRRRGQLILSLALRLPAIGRFPAVIGPKIHNILATTRHYGHVSHGVVIWSTIGYIERQDTELQPQAVSP